MPDHALGGGGVEQVGAVVQRALEPVRRARQRQREVELGGVRSHRGGAQRQPWQGQLRGRGVLEDEHHPEQRGLAQIAHGLELLEGHVLVGVGAERQLAHAAQQLAHGGVPVQAGAQDEGVEEEADQALQLGAVAAGDGGADAEVLLSGVARQQELEGRQEEHEGRDALAVAERLHAPGQLAWEYGGRQGARRRGRVRARPVSGQLQVLRRAVELAPPPGELLLQLRAIQPLALPGRVVRVLERRLRQGRGLARGEGGVEDGELTHQDAHGPAIRHDVVDVEQQHVPPLLQLQQHGAQQRAGGEAEGAQGLLVDEPPRLGLALLGGEPAQVEAGQGQRGGLGDALHGAFRLTLERGAQGLVAVHQGFQAPVQGPGVEHPVQLQGERHVEGGAAGLELVQEPQALLRVRDGQRLRARHALDGRERPHRTGAHGGIDAHGEGGHGGRLEEGAQGQLHAETRADAGDDPGGQQRVAAQLEEAVVGAHARQAQQLRPEAGEQLLRGRARGDVGRCRGSGQRLGRGQGPAVHLALGGEGQGVQSHQGGGHHVVRQPLLEEGAQRGEVQRLGRGDVAHQALVAMHVRACHHHRVADPGMGAQDGLHLAGLDAEAAHLDLGVRAAHEVQHAPVEPADPVPRAVEASPGEAGEGVGHEALSREGWLLHVAPRQAVSANEQLARDAHGHRLAARVQHVQVRAANGPADGHGGAHLLGPGHRPGGGEHRRLGGAIARGDGDAQLLHRAAHVGRGHHVAARQEVLHPAQPRRRGVHQLGEQAAGGPEQRHSRGLEDVAQLFQGRHLGRHHHQAGAVQERAPDFQGGGVEGDGREVEEDFVGPEAGVVDVQQGAQDVAVGDADALGPAGGAGGEVDIGERVGQGRRSRGVSGCGGERGLLQHDGEEPLRGQLREEGARGDEHVRSGVLHHGGEALARIRRVQRDVGATGLEDGHQRDNQLQGAFDGEGHARVGGHAQAAQVPGERVGALIELPVGELRAGELDGDLVGEAGHHPREDVGQGGLSRGGGGGRAPLPQHLLALGIGQEGQLTQPGVGPGHQRLQRQGPVLQQPLQAGRLEPRRVVRQPQLQPRARDDDGHQRQVRLFERADVTDAQLGAGRLHRGVDRVVLEHEQRLEQRGAARHRAPALDSHQRRMLVLALPSLLRVQPLEPREDPGLLVHADAHGQRVDEQAHRAVDAGQLGGAAGAGGAEDDVVLARVAREHQRPGSLHHGVGRELVLADERLERRAGLGGHRRVQLPAPVGHAGPLRNESGQRRGGGEAAQRLAPVRLRALHRLALEPGDIVAEGQGHALLERAAGAKLLVGREQLLEDDAQAPAVDEQVVVGPEDAVRALAQAHHRQARQRRAEQVEPARTVLGDQGVEARLMLRFGHVAPVMLLPGQGRARVDHLQGLLEPVPYKGGAQHRVARHGGLPRAPEGGQVHRPAERPGELRDVDARRGLRERVEEHALLEGRQRVQVLHGQARRQQPVERGRLQLRQREVGRRVAARILGSAGGDELPQRGEAARGQGLDGVLVVHGRAVRPAQRQPALEDVAVDLQQPGSLALGAPERAGGLARRREGQRPGGLGAADLVELAQVVEEHLRVGRLAESARLFIAPQVAQQAVADAAPRQPPQRVAHGAQAVAERGGAGHVQHHRVGGGEPAHRAGQVHVVEERLAAVAFQRHAQPGLARPLRQAAGQRGQQHVLDVRAPRGGRLLQQQACLLRVQRHLHHAGVGQGVGRAGHVHRKGRHLEAALLQPVGQLARQVLGAGEGVELLRPGLEGGGLGRQHRRLSPLELRVRGGQVLQQRAPGDAVDGEVVHRQQQPGRGVRARVEEAGAQQQALLQVEALLEARGLGFQRPGPSGLGSGGQVHPRQPHRGLRAGQLLPPLAVRPAREAQAQGVVVGHQGLERLLQARHVHRPARGEHDGLVVVVHPGGGLLEEGALDGRQRHGALHPSLLGLDVAFLLRHARQGLQRLVLEDVVGGQVQAGLPGARDELDGEDGVAAQLEEVVVQPDAGHAQQLRPDGGQGDFPGRAWRGEVPGVALLNLRDWQRLAVHLAAGRERQGRKHDQGGGHHELRQPLGEEGPQGLGLRRGARALLGGGHDVRDEPRAGGPVGAHHGHGLGDGRPGAQRGLDFAQLNPEATQLHLEVGAAQVLQRAVGLPAHAVAGAVQACAGLGAEGVGDEALGGEVGAAEVAAGQAHAAEEQLAGHAHGHRAQVRVQHVDADVGQGPADGGLEAVGHARGLGGADGGLGGAIGVDEAAAGGPLRHQLGGAGLTGGDDGAQLTQPFGVQHAQGGGRQGGHVDVPRAQQLLEGGAGQQRLARGQAEGGAGEQRGEDLPDGRVEAGGSELEHAGAGPQALGLHLTLDQVGHAPVRHHDALGTAGAARGVDDVGEVGGGDADLGRRGGLPREQRRVRVHQDELLAPRGQLVRQRLRGDDDGDGRVGEHEGQPVRGVAGVQRDEGAAGLEHAEHGHDEVDAALQVQRDERVRAHAQAAQVVRELVGARVQLAVAQGRVFVQQGGGVGGGAGLGLEARVHGGAVPEGHGRAVPRHQHALALGVVQHRQLGQAPPRVRGEGLQQRPEVAQQPPHRRLLEEVRAVQGDEAQALGQRGGEQRQVHLAGAAVHRLRFQHQPRHVQRGQGRVLQGEAHLEQG